MKITKRLWIVVCLVGICGLSQAQDRPIMKKRTKPEDFWNKTFIGITLTPAFGNNTLGAYISPTFGYHITENFSAAAGPLYMFSTTINNNQRSTSSIWGGRILANYRIYRTFHVHGEYEIMGVPKGYNANGSLERTTIGNPLVGISFINDTEKGFQTLAILYNLNDNVLSPYGTIFGVPIIIRASLNFNLGRN